MQSEEWDAGEVGCCGEANFTEKMTSMLRSEG